jgi:hypothetical protein
MLTAVLTYIHSYAVQGIINSTMPCAEHCCMSMSTLVLKMCHSVMLNEHYLSLFDSKRGIILMHYCIVLCTNIQSYYNIYLYSSLAD